MSQPYAYSENHSQVYYPPTSFDSTIQPQHIQPPTSSYDYQNNYYNHTSSHTASVAPSVHASAVNDSSVLVQPYTYPNGYAVETTGAFPAYGSTFINTSPDHMITHHPDSANQIPHQGVPQCGNASTSQTWTGPEVESQYVEVPTVQQGDLYDQRRGSCASMGSNTTSWHSHDEPSAGHFNPHAVVDQNYRTNYYDHGYQHQQQISSSFGMSSPGQQARIQELARAAPCEAAPNQWVPSSNLSETQYGMLPIHEPEVKYERRTSDAYQTFDNGSVGHDHSSPCVSFHSSPAHLPTEECSDPALFDDRSRDLFVQQRQAASYQQELQAQQELKYQLSGHLEQFEVNHRRQDSFPMEQDYSYSPRHQRQNSSSSDHSHRLLPAPVVPSQARERPQPFAQPSPDVEEKKETPPKKPALACLFCRKRKIACGPPPPDSPDRTCNQCLRRKQPCEYPTESRRGIRKAPKEPAPEEPTVHKFVHGDASSHDGTGAIRSRGRRKRTVD
ncbi:unnamed protein product [Rhizoctonia solani]|uniref:Zn(2)-C6 fungal-type domain-containing protein n=1 Tax=Rhizoctonia solani TaxID=456999 RepID=A0A8H3A452_9AGAM|nr:unnamed protein product [Rhizoctonia solani]